MGDKKMYATMQVPEGIELETEGRNIAFIAEGGIELCEALNKFQDVVELARWTVANNIKTRHENAAS